MPRLEAAEGELLVRVHAAGVNAIDWKIRAGHLQQMIPYSFPLTLGLDFFAVAFNSFDQHYGQTK